MKVQKFIAPYNKFDKPTLQNSWKKSGVYLIKEDDKIVYVGHSKSNLYKTMYRHFQKWDSHQTRATYKAKGNKRKKYKVRIILTTPKQAERLERVLCKKYNPRDMKYKYLQLELDLKDKQLEKDYFIQPVEEVPF